jgi:cephalosporin hydroxylase
MSVYLRIRSSLKKVKLVRSAVQFAKLFMRLFFSWFAKAKLLLIGRKDWQLLKEMRPKVRALYPLGLNLKNSGGFPNYYHGKNILGYSGMSFMEKDGVNVGLSEGRVKSGNFELPIVQLKTDMEINYKNLFAKARPNFVVDFGTHHGGSAVYFYQLMQTYCRPNLLTIDITDKAYNQYAGFHKNFGTNEKIKLILDKSSLDCAPEVKKFLHSRAPGEKALLSFDDAHSYVHTFRELEIYGPLLQSGDTILMQDTWNQGLFGHETSPMLAVYRFLKKHLEFVLDENFCKSMVLPCNFIYGVIEKK